MNDFGLKHSWLVAVEKYLCSAIIRLVFGLKDKFNENLVMLIES